MDESLIRSLDTDEEDDFRRETGLDPSGQAWWDAEDFRRASAWLSKHASEPETEGERAESETRQKSADIISNTVLSHNHEQ